MSYTHLGLRTAILLTIMAPVTASGQLINGSFDSSGGSLIGWETFNNVGPNVVVDGGSPFDGTHACKIFGGLNDNPNFSGILQNLPALPGELWTLTAQVRQDSGDPLTGTSNSLAMKIEFYRVPGGVYGSADMLSETSVTVLDAASPSDMWLPQTLEETAPPDTVEARVAIVFTNQNFDGGAAFIDAVSFQADACTEDVPDMALVWADEFDGNALDPSNWEIMIGTGINYGLPAGWGNNELQYYRAENIDVSGGTLTITAREENFGGRDYTSARMRSLNMADFLYGRFEGRIKVPTGPGMWPAFWMLPTDSAYGIWAASGEIDIMESVNIATTSYGTIHFGGTWPNNTFSGGTISGGVDYSDDFHVYAIEWEPDFIRWYVDDVLFHIEHSANWFSANAPGDPRAPFDELFHLLLNVAVGGDFPGPPNASTSFPQEMVVDWVRVYQSVDPVVQSCCMPDDTCADDQDPDCCIQNGGTLLQTDEFCSIPITCCVEERGCFTADPLCCLAQSGEIAPLLAFEDSTLAGASTDGTVGEDEYVLSVAGINSAGGDRIGSGSSVLLDSSAEGVLNVAINSATTWPNPSSRGVVIYIDTQDGGFTSTVALADDTDAARRLASGVGLSGQQSDLLFSAGFRANFALCVGSDRATLLELGTPHTQVNAVDLEAPIDALGGTEFAYRSADGTPTATARELRLPLSHLGLQSGDPLELFATYLTGNSAFRYDEFVGVAPGNSWDGANIGQNTTLLKPGDLIRFTTVSAESCFLDEDGDGYGTDLSMPSGDGDCGDLGESVFNTDCDDEDPEAFPGAAETPDDGIDQDCNGFDTVTCFVDGDGDGFGSEATLLANDADCTGDGESDVDTDCDDEDSANFPGNTEVCDGQDNNCNQQVDESPLCAGTCPNGTIAECADGNDDGIRDDGCLFWSCEAGDCLSIALTYADMGGSNGSCSPDGTSDGNDRFHALNCFSNQSTSGAFGYPCADEPPTAFNVDAAGLGAPCAPDGVCDGNDAFAALNAFDGSTTCSCSGPAPTGGHTRPVAQSASLELRAESDWVRRGDTVRVDAWLIGKLDDLRGYQLHVDVQGGLIGSFELVDIAVHPHRPLQRQRDRSGRVHHPLANHAWWSAFNIDTAQMLVGMDEPGVATGEQTYLGSFTFRVGKSAAGTFNVALRTDAPQGRTWLFPTHPAGRIEIVENRPLTLWVPHKRTRGKPQATQPRK